MVKVTIVTAYNSEIDMTIKFLDNLVEMTKYFEGDIHTIVVNGGNPVDISHKFVNDLVHLDVNEGFCKTLNAGLRRIPTDTDYVFFVGNDSFPIDTDWLRLLILLLKDTDAWMACPANDRPGMGAYTHLYTKDCKYYWEADFFPSVAWLMPYDKFLKVGLLDEDYVRTGMYADNDYCAKIKSHGGLIVVSKYIMLKHLLSVEGKKLGTQNIDMQVNGELFRKKWNK